MPTQTGYFILSKINNLETNREIMTNLCRKIKPKKHEESRERQKFG